jgi:hypothetical protein
MCYLPYLYLVVFYSYVIRAIITLGRIPTPDNPDPKWLGFDKHRQFVYDSLTIFLITTGVTLILFLILYLRKRMSINKTHLTIFWIGVIGTIVDNIVNPFNAWFLD